MTTLAARLMAGAHPIESKPKTVSPGNTFDLSVEDLREDLDGNEQDTEALFGFDDEISQECAKLDAMASLANTYGERIAQGDERAKVDYNVSMEALLTSLGVSLPVSVFDLSFEATYDHDEFDDKDKKAKSDRTDVVKYNKDEAHKNRNAQEKAEHEANEKLKKEHEDETQARADRSKTAPRQAWYQKAWDAIKAAIQKLAEMFRNLITRFINTGKSVEAKVSELEVKLQARINEIKREGLKVTKDKVSVGLPAKYLRDRGGVTLKPLALCDKNISMLDEYYGTIEGVAGKVFSFNPREGDDAQKWVVKFSLKGTYTSSTCESIRIEDGKDSKRPLAGGKITRIFNDPKTEHASDAPALEVIDLENGLSALRKYVTAVKKIEEMISKRDKDAFSFITSLHIPGTVTKIRKGIMDGYARKGEKTKGTVYEKLYNDEKQWNEQADQVIDMVTYWRDAFRTVIKAYSIALPTHYQIMTATMTYLHAGANNFHKAVKP